MASYSQLEGFTTRLVQSSTGLTMVVSNPCWGLRASHEVRDPQTGTNWDLAVLELELVSVLVELRLNG